jgi:hypothetical protein
MSSGVETVDLVETWLYNVLQGDATLGLLVEDRVVGTLVPLGTLKLPYVLFTFSGSRDVTSVDGTIIDTINMYTVKAVTASSSWTGARLIARRMHELIQGKSVTLTPTGSLTCVRDRIVQYPEEVAGQQYRHLGGIYRICASAD